MTESIKSRKVIDTSSIIVKKEIENLIIKWALIDPIYLDASFQVCDGTAWRPGSYAETYWGTRGLTNIPDLRGYGIRAADKGKTVDPDRLDRRQVVTGNVLAVSTTSTILFPIYYCKIIKEALDANRTVVIGTPAAALPTAIFDTLTIYGTVTAVDLSTNIVTIGTITGTFTTGSKSLVIKGDTIGSFQDDAVGEHSHLLNVGHVPWAEFSGGNYTVGFANHPTLSGNHVMNNNNLASTIHSGKTSTESRIKNISYLPIMWVSPPNSSSLVVDSTLMSIATDTEAQAGIRNDVVLTPYELRKALNADGNAPVFACRAWVNFKGTGTVAIRASGNVSSVTDDGTGLWTINFTTPMPDVNYTGHASSTNTTTQYYFTGVYPCSVSQVKISSWYNSFEDADYVLVTIFR